MNDFDSFPPRNRSERRRLPYRSGMRGSMPIPLTPQLVLAAMIVRAMRLKLELYMPRATTRWN